MKRFLINILNLGNANYAGITLPINILIRSNNICNLGNAAYDSRVLCQKDLVKMLSK